MCLVEGIVVFFFQAEDGIRDSVASRGLGDVYKRQDLLTALASSRAGEKRFVPEDVGNDETKIMPSADTVSYTHLTLPTILLV